MKLSVRYSLAMSAGVALAICAGPAFAQSPTDSSGNAPQRQIQLVQAPAQLSTTLDAKKAKQGEAVTAKLSSDVQIPNAQQLPKNTVLEGHVDQVQPSQNKSDSTVVVTFDKAKLKNGQELPIKATVISISEPVNQFQQAQAGGAAAGPGGMPAGGGTAAPSGPAGGSSGASGMQSSPPPQPMPQEGGAGAEQQAQQQGQKQGVPGVMLTSDIHQHTSATFTSKGRNVKVPNGTQLAIAIAVIPPGVNIQ